VTAIFALSYLAHGSEFWYFYFYGYDATPVEIKEFMTSTEPIEFSEKWSHHMQHEMSKIIISFWWDIMPFALMFQW